MELFDTHAHLNDERFSEDIAEVLQRAKAAGVTRMLLAGSNIEDSAKSIEIIAERSSDEMLLWCSVGVHPHHASEYDDSMHGQLSAWLKNRDANRVVALGEIGLDYHYDFSPREVQKEVFIRQLHLAYQMDIPIILHEREAAGDMMNILLEFYRGGKLRSIPGVCHCFSGSLETSRQLISMGFYLGFDGPITFKNNRKAGEIIAETPLDRLLIETDCPYLTPEPHRGKRNEPAFVRHVLDKMAAIKEMTEDELAIATTSNARILFGV
jgi:TatD DNase family protein